MKPVIFDFKTFLINNEQNNEQNENLSKIKFNSPETRNNNIIIPIKIKINEKEKKHIPLIFKTPKMYMPFKPHISNSLGGYIRLAFDNIKIDNNLKDFYNFINSTEVYLENKLNNSGMINSNNNNTTIKKSKITFKKTIQKTEGYADYFNLNFNVNDITIYDNDLSLISIDNVSGNFYAYFIIELTGFYYKQKTKEIKLIWSLVQFKLDKVKNKIHECLFLDEEELEQETLKTHLKEQEKKQEQEKKVNFLKNHILLEKFFKMLSIGIPKIAIQHKMSLSNIDIRFLDYSSDTDIDKLPIELKNKLNDLENNSNSNINSNINTNSNTNSENNENNNKSLLSNLEMIKNNKKNLKNISLTEHKSLKNKIIEKLSNKSLLVPSLEQINDAYKKLNKVQFKII